MPNVARLAAREVLLQPLPSLRVGQNHTTSSAIHRVDFVGTLVPWPNFEGDVIAAFTSQTWDTQTIDVIISGLGAGDSVSEEQLVLGDETGLQGRLNERLSRPVTTCLQAQGRLLRVGDFKASRKAARSGYSRVPDLVVLDNGAATKVVGEVKAPWPVSHVRMLSRGVRLFQMGQEHQLRRILGQVARYMKDLNVRHAFLSTYEETMFLRKIDTTTGWALQFSPVITHDPQYSNPMRTITTRQGLFYLALLGQTAQPFATRPSRSQWTT
ncbi:hypothetical protein PENNAL_c0005G08998 [Penicillium nalgiovense]|uniref:Fungal-type protein kinase domain-containing protein n=1 Tax=Penicillium nalgiovense TaxID=60175 RepID=A0A1V6Z237_PENNA|nr:hypothetical protein PENNAL_c0005G08998 [Penicillium nalgiovense]CAG8001507.1 unnamed protein product [Penicillium nalgiovense]